MKNFISIVLTICLICGLFTFDVTAANNENVKGNILTESQAIDVFKVGKISPIVTRSTTSNNSAFLKINQSSIKDSNITITGDVSTTEQIIPFKFTGIICKSMMQDKGFNAYCGKLKDEYNNFEVLHFFIKQDNKAYQYVLDNTLRSKELFLLYLKDQCDNILIFEDELENLVLSSDSVIETNNTADSSDDILWFGKIMPGEYEEIEEVVPRSVYNNVVYTPTVQKTTICYGQTWKEQAKGKVWTYVGDVPTAGSAVFKTALKLEEFLYIDGVSEGNSTNFTIQEDPTKPLKLNFGVGYNSVWDYALWKGTYWKLGSSTESPSMSLSFGWAKGPVSASCSLLTLTLSKDTYVKDSEYYTESPDCKNLGLEIPTSKKLYLKNDGDRIDFIGHVSTRNSSLTANKTTSARSAWSFQINYLPDTPNQIKHTATDLGSTVSYISNVK